MLMSTLNTGLDRIQTSPPLLPDEQKRCGAFQSPSLAMSYRKNFA